MTTAEAASNPTTSLHRNLAKASATMADNRKVIADLMAQGLTREQAWQRALLGR